MHFLRDEYGNAGSRTHEFGLIAKRAVAEAREKIAHVVAAEQNEVVFTSGATESNNLAILGLAAAAEKAGRRHIISSPLEHKAVLEPLEQLAKRGFEIELLPADERGWTDPAALEEALRPETFLVSLMHVNNETGVRQPIEEYARALEGHDAYFHVDAAQGFGKDLDSLRSKRIDLISVSGHKIYGPKGVGALIARRRGFDRPPLVPQSFGGGQEGTLRPGTLPVPLIAGLGKAAELAIKDAVERSASNSSRLRAALDAMRSVGAELNGDEDCLLGNAINVSFPSLDSEAVMLALKGVAAVSNGSACTSHDYKPSHVLTAMDLDQDRVGAAVRVSWCHLTPGVDWLTVTEPIRRLSPLWEATT
jgi:cysteine desulfurase